MPNNAKKPVNLELKLEPVPADSQQPLMDGEKPKAKAKKPKATKRETAKKPSIIVPNQQPVDNQQQWTTYNSEAIVNTHFIPLLGEARKFYPKLEFCDTQVRLTSMINGQSACFVNNSVTTTKRKDFEFLPVLLEWRQTYLCALLGLTLEQLEQQSRIDDDILMLHKSIKLFYASDAAATDPIVIKQQAEKLVREAFSYCHKCDIATDVFVRLQRLHIKMDVTLVLAVDDDGHMTKPVQKLIDVILD